MIKTIQNLQKCKHYRNMLEGLKDLAFKSPKSDKREMLLDVIKYGEEISTILQSHLNTIQYHEMKETALEFEIDRLKLELKKSNIDLEKREKQIKELI